MFLITILFIFIQKILLLTFIFKNKTTLNNKIKSRKKKERETEKEIKILRVGGLKTAPKIIESWAAGK